MLTHAPARHARLFRLLEENRTVVAGSASNRFLQPITLNGRTAESSTLACCPGRPGPDRSSLATASAGQAVILPTRALRVRLVFLARRATAGARCDRRRTRRSSRWANSASLDSANSTRCATSPGKFALQRALLPRSWLRIVRPRGRQIQMGCQRRVQACTRPMSWSQGL